MKKLVSSWAENSSLSDYADEYYKNCIDCYTNGLTYRGTAFQRKDNNQWEFIPVGSEVWTDGEEIVTYTKQLYDGCIF